MTEMFESNNGVWALSGLIAGMVLFLIILGIRRSRTSLVEQSHTPGTDSEIENLRQNLRLKVLYDEAKIDRLVQAERERTPTASEADWYRAAIEHWERDNR